MLVGDGVHHSLAVWRMVWAQAYYSIRIKEAAIQKFIDSTKMRTLAALRASAGASKHGNHRAEAAVRKLLNRSVASALLTWWSKYLLAIQQRSIAMRVMRRMMLRNVGCCFNTWLAVSRDLGSQTSKMRKVLNRMLQRELARGFLNWYETSLDLKRKMDMGRRVLLRMMNGKLAAAFSTLRELVASGAQHSAVARVAARLMNAQLAAAFSSWRENAAEMKEEQRKMAGLLTRMLNRALSGAFNQWYSVAMDAKAQAEVLKKGLAKLLNAKLSQAWNTWRSNAAEMQRQKFIMAGFLRRMLNAKLSQAWEQWQFQAAEVKHQQQVLTQACMRLLKAKLTAAFSTWREAAADNGHQLRLMEGTIRRMLNRKLSQAFETLQAFAAAVREHRRILLKFVSRMLNRQLSNAWRCWYETAAQGAKQSAVIASVVKTWQMKDLVSCWNTWRDDASEAILCSFGLGTAHWAVRSTVTAFMSWRVLAAQQMVMRDWWAQSGVKSALGKWNGRAGSLHLFDRPSHSSGDVGAVELTGAYAGWLASLRDGRERGLLVMWAAIWWSITQLRVNMALWNHSARTRIEESEIRGCAGSFWDQRSQASCIMMWRWWAKPMQNVRALWDSNAPKRAAYEKQRKNQAMGMWRTCAWGWATELAANDQVFNKYGVMRPRQLASLKKWRDSARTGRRVQKAVMTLEGRDMDRLPPWAKHRLNWGMEVWRQRAPRGVGGLAYSSASLANESDKGEWANTMSQFYLGLRSPAAYRRSVRRSSLGDSLG